MTRKEPSRSLRLLHVTAGYAPAWTLGGPPRSTANLCEGLAARGHDVTVLTTKLGLKDRDDLPEGVPVRRNGVTVFYYPLNPGPGIRSSALDHASSLRCREADLVHVTGVWQLTSVAACRAARSAGVPYVVSPRGALSRYSFSKKRVKKMLYWLLFERSNVGRAAGIHYTAEAERRECGRLGLAPRSWVVPNSLDLEAWSRDPEGALSWRARHGIGPEECVFLSSGRLHHKKGLELLVEAAAGLPATAPWRLVFAGPDEDGTGERLLRLARAEGIADRVVLTGALDTAELARAYSASGLFLFPSLNENFGNVAVEALACGSRIALASDVGSSEALADVQGVSVLPREASLWRSRMACAIGEGPLGADEQSARRALIVARFGRDAVAEAMESAYRSILGPAAAKEALP